MATFDSGDKARILILDEHPMVREGLALIINREHDLVSCGQADTFHALDEVVDGSRPHLVTIDLGLHNGEGLEVIKSLRARHPSLPMLVISQHDEMVYAERALRAGARGYVMKQQPTGKVLEAIRTILAGELYFSPQIAALALRRFGQARSDKQNGGGVAQLSNRELQVLQLLGAGLGTRVIADRLGLSIKTIEAHREHIKYKLGLSSAPQLLHYATNWLNGPSSRHIPDTTSGVAETRA